MFHPEPLQINPLQQLPPRPRFLPLPSLPLLIRSLPSRINRIILTLRKPILRTPLQQISTRFFVDNKNRRR